MDDGNCDCCCLTDCLTPNRRVQAGRSGDALKRPDSFDQWDGGVGGAGAGRGEAAVLDHAQRIKRSHKGKEADIGCVLWCDQR